MEPQFRELPLEERAFLRTLQRAKDKPRYWARLAELHDAGYSYTVLGKAMGVSRQRVHQLVAAANGTAKPRAKAPRSEVKEVVPATMSLLEWAWTTSASRRGSTDDWSLPAAAHKILVDTVTELVSEGVRFAQIADALGVAEGTVRGRMLRAGVTRKGVRQEQVGDVA